MATKIESDGDTTVIGESVRIRGNLNGDEDLHVLGRVEGSVELKRTLIVAESGIVKAEVAVKNAVISGVVVGNVSATESVELTAEGRMVGDIIAPRIIIVDGASFRGNVDMGDIENMPTRPARTERPRPTLSRRPEPKKAEPEAEEQEPEADADEVDEAPAPKKTVVAKDPDRTKTTAVKKPSFLDPPKAKGLPKKSKKNKQKRVVVKRK